MEGVIMAYTWGYIKEATLAKLDMTSDDAIALGYMNRFYIYANEAIGQISGAVKSKLEYINFKVVHKDRLLKYLARKYDIKNFDFLKTDKYNYEDLSENLKNCYNEYYSYTFIGDIVKMPDDYIAFAIGSRAYVTRYHYGMTPQGFIVMENFREIADESYLLYGSKTIQFLEPGLYNIPYEARWCMFSSTTPDDEVLDIPSQICDAIPSYIASQIFKVDDEQKAAIMRNEFEILVSRINDNDDTEPEAIIVGGDW